MRWRFGRYELDLARSELRDDGRALPLQPQVLSVLGYLVAHRDRLVTKEELLRTLWAGAFVTDASLQRAVSLARRALRPEDRRLIRTHARHGYRFAGAAEELPAIAPELADGLDGPVRYARCDDVHIGFRTVGAGPLDLVLVFGWSFCMRAALELPAARALVEDLSGVARVVLFDKRGTGASDRVRAPASLAERARDLDAVLAAVGSRRAVLIGFSEGAPLAVHCAVADARVRGLVLVGAFARMAAGPDHPHGWSAAEIERLREYVEQHWGSGATFRAMVPERHRGPWLSRWAARAEQEGASPGAALDLVAMNLAIDVRPLLGRLRVPAAVLHAAGDRVIGAASGRDLAARIPGARHVELPGDDHACFFEGRPVLVGEVQRIVARASEAAAPGSADGDGGDLGADRDEQAPQHERLH